MSTVHGSLDTLVFGPFRLDPKASSLTREGALVSVEPKVFVALHHLVRHAGALVTREQLLEAVWPDVVVSDDSVSQIVRKVRTVLGEGRGTPTWLKTVHGQGYRFVGSVRVPVVAQVARRRRTDGFFGRDDLLATLEEALQRPGGVVTLLGPGGIGKTRLTSEYLHQSAERWGGSLWLAHCASARTMAELVSAVGAAISVPLTGDAEPEHHLIDVLALRPSGLLVLDNLEQVIEPARQLLDRLLERAPHLHYLVSSRLPLDLPEERRVPVGPLDPRAAGELFRARASTSGLPDEVVAKLVRGLEGDPLSIELAAARAAILPAEQLTERLDERLVLLGRRKDTSRHGNLRNNLAWTWDLLDDDQKAFLEQCAGFRGGFDTQMAEQTVQLPSGQWPGDVAQDLADCGLLRSDSALGVARLRLPEALRLFCVDLATQRPDASEVALRQAQSLDRRTIPLVRRLRRGEHPLEVLQGWLPDLRAGLETSLTSDPDLGGRLALAMHEVLSSAGPHAEGIAAIERALQAQPSPDLELELLCARLWYPMGESDSKVWLRRARELEARAGDAARLRLFDTRARVAHREGDREAAVAIAREGLALAEAIGDLDAVAELLCDEASALRVLGRSDESIARTAEALALGTLSPRMRAIIVQTQALAHHRAGRIQEAHQGIDELEVLADRLGDLRMKLTVHSFRGIQAMEAGDSAVTHREFDRALDLGRQLGDRAFEARLLVNLTAVQISEGQWEAASGTARRGRQVAHQVGDAEGELVAGVNLGIARLMAGAPAEAWQVLVELQDLPAGRLSGWLLLWSAVARAQAGEVRQATEMLERAREALAPLGDPMAPPCLSLAHAILVACRGDTGQARTLAGSLAPPSNHKAQLLRQLLERHV